MEELEKAKFERGLAVDLAIYTMIFLIGNEENKLKATYTHLNNWSEQLTKSMEIVKKTIAKKIVEQNEDIPEDVAMILLDVHNTEKIMEKDTFKKQIYKEVVKILSKTKLGV